MKKYFIDGALDRIKEILGLGSDDDSDASTSIFEGPIDLGDEIN